MNQLRLALFPLLALLLGSCAAPLPRHDAFGHFYDQYMLQATPKMEQLDADFEEGKISQSQYERRRTEIHGNITAKVNSLVWHNHRLRENEWERFGLPTPSEGQGPAWGTDEAGPILGGSGGSAPAPGDWVGAGGPAVGSAGGQVGGGAGRGNYGIGHASGGRGPVGRIY